MKNLFKTSLLVACISLSISSLEAAKKRAPKRRATEQGGVVKRIEWADGTVFYVDAGIAASRYEAVDFLPEVDTDTKSDSGESSSSHDRK